MSLGRRGLVDRLLRFARPSPVEDFTPPPRPLAPGLWVLDRKIRLPGRAILSTRATAVRLSGGEVFLHAPVHLDEATRSQLKSLGPLRCVVAPNSFHYLYVPEYLRAFPSAEFYRAPGLAERVPDLPAGCTLGDEARPLWRDDLEQAVFGPVAGVSEIVFLHPSSRTLILTDLVLNVRGAEDLPSRLYLRMNDAWNRFGPSLSVRTVLLRDRALVRRFLRRILRWEFDRIVMAHGDVLETGGPAALEKAFASYLTEAQPP